MHRCPRSHAAKHECIDLPQVKSHNLLLPALVGSAPQRTYMCMPGMQSDDGAPASPARPSQLPAQAQSSAAQPPNALSGALKTFSSRMWSRMGAGPAQADA